MNSDFLCEKRLAILNPLYNTLVKNTAFVLCNALERYKQFFPDYTDHTILHSMQVIDFCNRLIGENIDKLNEDEIYVLLMSAYLHDCGMGISEADYRLLYDDVVSIEYVKQHPHGDIVETIRAFHQKFSNKLICKYADLFEIPSEEHTTAIALVSEGHRKTDLYDEKTLPTVIKVPNGNEIHLPYLTALIRLADELDIAADRNLGIGDNGQDTIFKLMHRSIKHLHILPDKFVLDVETEDPALYDGIEREIKKLDETFRLCSDVIKKRTPFSLTQKSVEINRIKGDKKHIFVLDTDLGTDDACAVLLLKILPFKPDYVVCSYGNTTLDGACRNGVILKKYLGLDYTLVKGLPMPENPDLPEGEKAFHGIDGFGGISGEMEEKLNITDSEREDIISYNEFYSRLSEVDIITYVTIGTTTNLSELLSDDAIRRKVSGIYIMGGGIKEFNSPMDTEFNFSKHPDSVRYLLTSGLNITLFPLDVTNHQYLTEEDIDSLEEIGVYPEYIHFLRFNLESNRRFNNFNKSVLHDTLPILYLAYPALFGLEDMRLTCDKYGHTEIAAEGEAVHVCTFCEKNTVRGFMRKVFEEKKSERI